MFPCCYHFLEARRRDRVSLRLPPRRTRCTAANADKHTDFKQLSLSLMSKVRSFILFFSLFFLRFQPLHPLTPTQILLVPPSLKCLFFSLPHSASIFQPHPLHPSAPSQLNSGASASERANARSRQALIHLKLTGRADYGDGFLLQKSYQRHLCRGNTCRDMKALPEFN